MDCAEWCECHFIALCLLSVVVDVIVVIVVVVSLQVMLLSLPVLQPQTLPPSRTVQYSADGIEGPEPRRSEELLSDKLRAIEVHKCDKKTSLVVLYGAGALLVLYLVDK